MSVKGHHLKRCLRFGPVDGAVPFEHVTKALCGAAPFYTNSKLSFVLQTDSSNRGLAFTNRRISYTKDVLIELASSPLAEEQPIIESEAGWALLSQKVEGLNCLVRSMPYTTNSWGAPSLYESHKSRKLDFATEISGLLIIQLEVDTQ